MLANKAEFCRYGLKFVMVSFFLSLLACSNSVTQTLIPASEPPETFPVLTGVGYAPIDAQPADSASEKVIMAMQSSKVMAYRELAEQIFGQQLNSKTKVQEWMVKNQMTSTQVSGLIRGAKVVKAYPTEGYYVTELELDFKLVWDLYQQHKSPSDKKPIIVENIQRF